MPTALIVEDEAEANKLLSLIVQMRGYHTESAFSGDEALAMAESSRPDIVFLDLMLPDTNGLEVCRALKSKPETSLVPVVIVTARLEAENRAECFQIGAQLFVPKPYTPNQIFDALASADAWIRELDCCPDEGSFILDGPANRAQAFSRLRCLLTARTPLAKSALEIVDAVDRAASNGKSLTYAIRPDRLEITLERAALDETPDAQTAPSLRAAFDTVTFDQDAMNIKLIKYYEHNSDK